MKKIYMYTDGACRGNPGPGGWGTILRYKDNERVLSGGEANTTNNRMELTAVIKGLESLKTKCDVEIYSDSKYIIDAITLGWANKWRANNWYRNNKDKALNQDLWERLLDLIEVNQVKFIWVKGHSGHPENERCDKLAVAESQKF